MRGIVRLAAAAVAVFSSPVLAQDRPIVAIYQMEDLAGTGQGETLSTMIETAVAATSKFRVMERSRLGTLLSEQGKGATGLVTTNRPGEVGGFEGVDYLIYGSITGLSVQRKADIGAALLGGLLSNGVGTTNCETGEATLGLDIRITDAQTGEVRYVTSINQKQRAGTACGSSTAQIDATGLLRSAADNVASGLVTAIYPIQVAAVQADGSVVLNYGQGSITEGAYMTIFQKGEAIIDPATGESIGSDEFPLGLVQITQVLPRMSRASPVGAFSTRPSVGDIARVATAAETSQARRRSR